MSKHPWLAALIGTMLSLSVSAQCAYSAYVDFGPAPTGGYLDKKERVYRSSGLIRNKRDVDERKNYFAAYTSYRQTKSGEFELINIGPFDSEGVAYSALQETITRLTNQGYAKKTDAHSMPAVIVFNKNPC